MVRAVVDHDHVPDRVQLRPQRQEHRQRRAVDEHDVVLGVVRDVDLLLGEQPDVERVQHAAGARGGEVELQVRRGVPHERPDASVGRDAAVQRRGEPPHPHGPVRHRRRDLALRRGRDDRLVAEQLLGTVEDVRQGQRPVLHESAHRDPRRR